MISFPQRRKDAKEDAKKESRFFFASSVASLRLCARPSSNRVLAASYFPHVLLKTHPIGITHLQDARTDQVTTIILEALVPDRRHLHLYWPTRKLQLDVQLPIGSGEIVLTDANRRHNQREPRAANVERMTVERGNTACTITAHSRIRQTQSERQTCLQTPMPPPVANKTA